jgi:phosphatidate cytidylyltransferase
VLTAAVLIPVVLAVIAAPSPWPLAGLLALVAVISASELGRLLEERTVYLGLVVFAVLLAPLFGPAPSLLIAILPLSVLLLGVAGALFLAGRRSGAAGPLALFAAGWIVGPLAAVFALRWQIPQASWQWNSPLLLALVPIWAGDTAAIFAGRAFGKHRLAPNISPGKTWEGAIANLAACVAAGLLLSLWLPVPAIIAAGAGIMAGVLGQAGDLFQSYVKRSAGTKDSGTLLPGHGGLLDRIDSLLFAAPAVAALLLLTL